MYPPQKIAVISLFMLSVFYGFYIATLLHCLRWLIYTDDGWKRRDRISKIMLTTTILIFLLSTINLGINLQYALAFLGVKNWDPAEGILTVCDDGFWDEKSDLHLSL